MILKKVLFLVVFITIYNIGFTQDRGYSIKEEPIDLKGGKPLFDHLGKIIGRLEKVEIKNNNKERGGIYNYTIRTKVISNSGKVIEIDALNQKVIYVESANRIITYGLRINEHSFKITPDIFIYNDSGKLLKHIYPMNNSSSDIVISENGDVYTVGVYDEKQKGLSLICYQREGGFWAKKLPYNFQSFDQLRIILSSDSKRVGVIQNRLMDNISPHTVISVYDLNGTPLSEIKNDVGFNNFQFLGNDNLALFSNKLYCISFFSLLDKGLKENKCFDSSIDYTSRKNHEVSIYINPVPNYIMLYQKERNELVFLSNDSSKFETDRIIPIQDKDILTAESIVLLTNRIEIYHLDKQITIFFE